MQVNQAESDFLVGFCLNKRHRKQGVTFSPSPKSPPFSSSPAMGEPPEFRLILLYEKMPGFPPVFPVFPVIPRSGATLGSPLVPCLREAFYAVAILCTLKVPIF
jgi:hypothetical protein